MKSYQKILCIVIFLSAFAARKTKKSHKATKKIHRKLESAAEESPKIETPNPDIPISCKGSLSSTDPACDIYEVTCPQDVIKSFGLDGLPFSRIVSVDVCPSIIRSCCLPSDSEKILKNWSGNGVEQNLDKRLAFHISLLKDLFAQGSIINDKAIDVLRVLYTKPNTECKFMARRIAYFQAQEVFPVLLEKIKKAQSFFVKSYKGIFCGMCDAANASFFNNNGNKQLVVSGGFCRNLISRYLNTLLYYHVHIKKFFKLGAAFLTTCDAQGIFRKIDVPSEGISEINTTIAAELIRCKLARNSGLWLDACKPICSKFKLDSFDKYFEPDFKPFADMTEYIKKQIAAFSNPGASTTGDQANPIALASSTTTSPQKSNAARRLRLHNSYWNNNRVLEEEDIGTSSNGRNLGAKHNKKGIKKHNKNQNHSEKKHTKRKLVDSDKSDAKTEDKSKAPSATDPAVSAGPVDILKQFEENRSIYILPSKGKISLKDLTIDVRNIGVDLYMSGAMSDISSGTATSANAATAVSTQAGNTRRARKLKHATILGVVFSILSLLLC